MRPRAEWLDTFLAIADTGSLTRAGRRVARSQSAVSLQLQQLEELLGTRLFDRDTRHVRLTAAGERLVPLARRALEATDAAARVGQGSAPRTVRVGVPEEYADRLLPELLDVTGHGGGVRFEVECTASAELERRVDAHRLDLAVVLADEIRSRGLPICNDPVIWLEAPGHGLSRRRPLPVALFDQACSWRSKALDALDRAGIDFRVVFTSASVAGVRAGILSGVAVGALARSTAGSRLAPIPVVDAPPSLPHAELALIGAGLEDENAQPIVQRVRLAVTG
ncbi:MAG: LysR family transcriptional regulator [Halofilum sp. (in: g-proteobacteria)]|nr:LysR family transcriptional regulator [Halofilum sp. (in: g-proteobacteria)]